MNEAKFVKAQSWLTTANLIASLPTANILDWPKMTVEQQDLLFAYFKQATVGPFTTDHVPWWQTKAATENAKFDVWKGLAGMSSTEAKSNYILLVLAFLKQFQAIPQSTIQKVLVDEEGSRLSVIAFFRDLDEAVCVLEQQQYLTDVSSQYSDSRHVSKHSQLDVLSRSSSDPFMLERGLHHQALNRPSGSPFLLLNSPDINGLSRQSVISASTPPPLFQPHTNQLDSHISLAALDITLVETQNRVAELEKRVAGLEHDLVFGKAREDERKYVDRYGWVCAICLVLVLMYR